ncbi:MAG: hypothetical protein FWF96_01845 [Kiritimatiellaeota bacterium]|nr:hypothetical protein [Kiritimatiellota bacterium]
MKRLLALAALSAAASWANAQTFNTAGYTRRMPVFFAGYQAAETLTNFPALVRMDNTTTFDMLANGADLRFADAAGNELAFEIDTWRDPALGTLAWVQIQRLAPGTLIHAYWGHPTFNTAPAYTTDGSVWSNDFQFVQHFNNNATDASPFKYAASVNNCTYAPGGLLGQALQLPAINGSRINTPASLLLNTECTLGAWFKGLGPASQGLRTLFRLSNNYCPVLVSSDSLLGLQESALFPRALLLADDPPVWRHITVVFTGGQIKHYINGEWVLTTDYALTPGLNLACFGNNTSSSQRFAEFLDDFRIESQARSPAWIKAAYDTVATPGFAACGAPVDIAGPQVVHTLAAINLTRDGADITGLLDPGVVPQTIWLFYGTNDCGMVETGWEFSPVSSTVWAPGLFTNTVSGLTPDTEYHARFALDDGPGQYIWSQERATFTTPQNPAPILGAVTTNPGMAASDVSVEIEQLGYGSRLIFAWDASDKGDDLSAWAHAVTNDLPSTSPYIFVNAMPALNPGESVAWRVALTGEDRETAWKSGAFSFNREYSFMPAAGGAYDWDDANLWLNVASNLPDDGFPCLATDFARITNSAATGSQTLNLGAAISLGGLEFGVVHTHLNNAGGASITFDNGPAAAVLAKQNTAMDSFVNMPVFLESPLTIMNQHNEQTIQFNGPVTANNPAAFLNPGLGHFMWTPPDDTVFAPGIRGNGGFTKGGRKSLTLRGANAFFGGFNVLSRFGIIQGGSLIFDGGVFTNTAGNTETRLTAADFGTLVFSNGCQATTLKNIVIGDNTANNTQTNNTLLVTGAETVFDMNAKALNLGGVNCALKVEDNATLRNALNIYVGYSNQTGFNTCDVTDGATLAAGNVTMDGPFGTVTVDNAFFAIGANGIIFNNNGNHLVVTNNSAFNVVG